MSGVGFAVNHCDQIDIVDQSAGEGGDIINADIDPLIRNTNIMVPKTKPH